MTKYFNRKRKIKTAFIAVLSALTVSCTCIATACDNSNPKDEDDKTPPKREDSVQLLKNGDFEFFDYPEKSVYLIKSPDNWTRGGDSSYSTSGIIGTSKAAWDLLDDPDLADKLDANNELNSSDADYKDKYVNYNGARTRDLLYKDSYGALLEDDKIADSYIKNQTFAAYFGITKDESDAENVKYYQGEGEKRVQVYLSDNVSAENWEQGEFFYDEDFTKPVRKERIENPLTHYDLKTDDEGMYILDDKGDKIRVYEDERYVNEKNEKVGGDYFYYVDGDKTNDKDENKKYISNVLMVHNYNTNYNGITQYYSSQTITVEANTAAEISLWVKTSDLKFDKGYSLLNDQDRGAFIEVKQTVNGTTIDSTVIKAINTEKLIADNNSLGANNGWLQYRIFVNACSFGNSTIQLNLGLGRDATDEKCTGYAFFDDVSVTKHKNIEETSLDETKVEHTTCTLTDEGDDKVYIADKDIRGVSGTVNNPRNSADFDYYIDLAAAKDADGNLMEFKPFLFGASDNSVKIGLTTQTSKNYVGDEKTYAAALQNNAALALPSGANVGKTEIPAGGYTLPKGLNDAALDTANDLIGVFGHDATFSFGAGLKDYSLLLKTQLVDKGISNLPAFDNNNILLLFSAMGASYTATMEADATFKIAPDSYKVVSFWLKTADMSGSSAATAKVYFDDDHSTSISIDTTNNTTNIGDSEEEKDIYNGWVQCFFFVHNDTETEKTFKIDFGFGTSSITDATSSSFKYGWAAMSNVQTLDVSEAVYDLAADGDSSKKLTYSGTDDEKAQNKFDDVSNTSNIKQDISDPKNYNGVNGGSSIVADSEYKNEYDKANTNVFAGLINRDYEESYKNILSSFISGASNWNEVFGANCCQPLVIVNNIRYYASTKVADEDTYKNYYVLDNNATASDEKMLFNGKTYRKVRADEEFDENQTYYSNFDMVSNYGYVGQEETLTSSGYKTVSARVMVTGNAKAYIYLVDDDTKDVMSYSTPEVSFYYDDEGNVLDEEFDSEWTNNEHRSHIKYFVREDGLFSENADGSGQLYANIYNLDATYKHYRFKRDEDGKVTRYYKRVGDGVERVYFDDLENNVDYYIDEACKIKAPHFLSSSDGTRIYEFKNGTDSAYSEGYYYIYYNTDKDGNVSESLTEGGRQLKVKGFNKDYARSEAPTANDYEYFVEVGNTNGKWVTVNFFIKAGSEQKDYRVEYWSGKRGETGINEDGTYAEGAVAFDYSSTPAITEEEFTKRVSEYEKAIVGKYVKLLSDNGLLASLKSTEEPISYYEKFIDELDPSTANYNAIVAGKAAIKAQNNYKALYYAFSLYDSEDYVPFNKLTAEAGETGYEYTASDYDDAVAYLRYDTEAAYNLFIDYSVVDKSITVGTKDDTTPPEEDDKTETTGGEIWLYIASIILVVAMLVTLVSLLVRDAVKKMRIKKGVKNQSKNNYRQRERYIRKLGLVKAQPEETASEETNAAPETTEADAEIPAEEVTEEQPEEGAAETVEEAPAENGEAETAETEKPEGEDKE